MVNVEMVWDIKSILKPLILTHILTAPLFFNAFGMQGHCKDRDSVDLAPIYFILSLLSKTICVVTCSNLDLACKWAFLS